MARKAKLTLCFAYGSNMDALQMRMRCSAPRYVGPAVLDCYEIAFAGWSAKRQGSVATVVPSRRQSVPGVLWALTAEDFATLDLYEGAPHVYQRQACQVTTDDARTHDAILYAMNSPQFGLAPSFEYLQQIAHAYMHEGFEIDALVRAAKRAGFRL